MSRPGSFSSAGTGVPLAPGSDRIQTPVLDRNATQVRLQQAQARKSRTEQELQTLERVRSTTPNMSPFELDKKDKEIGYLKHQISGMETQIQQCLTHLQQAEATIKQQQATIHNQSKQIENPRGRDATFGAPNMPQYQSQHYTSVPPNFSNQPWNTSQSQPDMYHYGSARHQSDNQRFGSAQQSSSGQQTNLQQQKLGPPPAFNPQAPFAPNQPYESQTTKSIWGQANFNQAQQYSQTGLAISGNPPIYPTQTSVQATPLHRVNDVGSPESLRQHYPSTPSRQVIPSNSGISYTPSQSQLRTEKDVFNGAQKPYGTPSSSEQRGYQVQDSVYQSSQISGFAQNGSFASSYASTPLNSESGAMVPVCDLTIDQHVSDSIDHLFASVKNYAFNHVNFVNTAGDTALPEDLKQRIIRAGTLKTAFPIFKSPDTRYWLVTKIMIQWIIKHIFKQNVFSGFDAKIDELIEGTRSTLYQSTPAQLRYLLLKNIGDHIKNLTANGQFDQYLEYLVKDRTHQLFWLVRPMAHQPTMMDEQDMTDLVREAHHVARLMFTGTDEYRFVFYDAGPPECRYNPHHMRNVDPRYGNHDDEWLQRAHAVVRLCATPEVVVRKNNAYGTGQEAQAQKGRVLLKVRGDDCS